MAITFENGQEAATESSDVCNTGLSNAIVARGTIGILLVSVIESECCLNKSILYMYNHVGSDLNKDGC